MPFHVSLLVFLKYRYEQVPSLLKSVFTLKVKKKLFTRVYRALQGLILDSAFLTCCLLPLLTNSFAKLHTHHYWAWRLLCLEKHVSPVPIKPLASLPPIILFIQLSSESLSRHPQVIRCMPGVFLQQPISNSTLALNSLGSDNIPKNLVFIVLDILYYCTVSTW